MPDSAAQGLLCFVTCYNNAVFQEFVNVCETDCARWLEYSWSTDTALMNSGVNAPAILHINVSALVYIMERGPFMDWIKAGLWIMEKHGEKACYVNFLWKVRDKKKKKNKNTKKQNHLECGQSILVLFCHSAAWRELFMVINKGAHVWVFLRYNYKQKVVNLIFIRVELLFSYSGQEYTLTKTPCYFLSADLASICLGWRKVWLNIHDSTRHHKISCKKIYCRYKVNHVRAVHAHLQNTASFHCAGSS